MVQGSNPGGCESSSPVQLSPGDYLSFYTTSTESFPGVKWLGHGFNHTRARAHTHKHTHTHIHTHTHPTSTEVKERVYLKFHSPPGLSWSVLGQDLPYTPNMHPNLSQNLQNLIPNFFWNMEAKITSPLNFMTNFFAVLLEGTATKVLNSECQICLTVCKLPHSVVAWLSDS
jgi:hypothetical protein